MVRVRSIAVPLDRTRFSATVPAMAETARPGGCATRQPPNLERRDAYAGRAITPR